MVLSWILNSVLEEIAASVVYINIAKEMWIDKKERFSKRNSPTTLQLQKAIPSLSQENVLVSNYFTSLK
jgi:hypothetical protein